MQRILESVDKGEIMDLRIERTKRSIINAFLELRSKKPIEKITIKELSELAYINKATFYSHYRDIYDLSEQLENETIDRILANIPHPEDMIDNPKQVSETLAAAFISQRDLINTLFSGSRFSVLVTRLESRIKNKIYEMYPEYKNDLEKDIILTYLIQGGFHVFLSKSKDIEINKIMDIVGNIGERMLK